MSTTGQKEPWGVFEIPVDTAGRWRVGPLTLDIERKSHEWRLTHDIGEDPSDDDIGVELPYNSPDLFQSATVRRFGVSDPSCRVELGPLLADRSVIAKPEHPFVVPPGEASVVYLTSPLWVRVRYGKDGRILSDVPTYRPSDTWFGPTTDRGELAYAVTTFCRTSADELPWRPHRAFTRITIENRSPEPLDFEQVSLPAPRLKLYRSTDLGKFWTDDVGLLRESGGDFAALRLSGRAPIAAPKAVLVAPARQSSEVNAMVRAFGSLFDGIGGTGA